MRTYEIRRQPYSEGMENPLLLSVPEASHLLGVGTTFCWELVRSGKIPTVRLGRRVLVPRAAVERLARKPEFTEGLTG